MMKRTLQSLVGVALLVCALVFLNATSTQAPDAAYVQSFEKWKAEQTADLKENWLSLAGLFWLKPGPNTFGSDPANQIVFPKVPARAGEFDLAGKEVTLKLLPDAKATIAGKPVSEAKLDPDTSEQVTHVEMGNLRFHVIVRGARVEIRVRDTDSAAARTFKGMMFFPLDMNYRVMATWVPADGKKTVEIPNVLGDVTAQPVPGVVVFKVKGEELKLTALGGDAKNGLFIVFNDLTAKNDTYPGGGEVRQERTRSPLGLSAGRNNGDPLAPAHPRRTCKMPATGHSGLVTMNVWECRPGPLREAINSGILQAQRDQLTFGTQDRKAAGQSPVAGTHSFSHRRSGTDPATACRRRSAVGYEESGQQSKTAR
ncbi:MAG: DUF1684 domain-containing protein [Candidatus Sulfotelmatobacter sp.]